MGTGGGLVVIDFSEQGNSIHFLGEGWSGQEKDRVWAIGPRSVVRVPIQSAYRPIMIETELAPCDSPPSITGQIVRVRVNGTAVGGVRLAARSMVRCEIEPALARPDGILEIEFDFPGFYVPRSAGVANEDRPLACWFSFMRIYTTDMFQPGPHFPASRPEIPVISLSPPFADTAGASARVAPVVYTFDLPGGDAEDNDFTVTDGDFGQLKLLMPRAPGSYVMRVDACPLNVTENQPKRDVTIVLEGVVIGQIGLREPAIWLVPLPRELTDGRDILRLNFMVAKAEARGDDDASSEAGPKGIAVTRVGVYPLPANLSPAESLRAASPRPIAVSGQFLTEDAAALPAAVSAVLGMDAAMLPRRFESLGIDREFGIVQRKLGFEGVNLFRFCEGTLADLTRALTDDLRMADDSGQVTGAADDPAPRAYNLRWEAFCLQNDLDHDALRQANATTMRYLRRKFYEGLSAGRKIYVLKQRRPVGVDQAASILMELNRSGAALLLCVEEAFGARSPGAVELITPGIMRGYIRRFAPDDDIEAADPADWLRVLANATLLQRERHAGAAS